jgi:hypothetical protein
MPRLFSIKITSFSNIIVSFLIKFSFPQPTWGLLGLNRSDFRWFGKYKQALMLVYVDIRLYFCYYINNNIINEHKRALHISIWTKTKLLLKKNARGEFV